MSNGSSVLDESASALFAYAAPELERRKVLFEELCRSFDGNDMQGEDDQMLLFGKLSAGLFDDTILMGLCMHAMVRWKGDEQQLPRTAERQKVSMYLEQERLFQEQLKDDVMERRHGTAQVASWNYRTSEAAQRGRTGSKMSNAGQTLGSPPDESESAL